MMIKSIRRRYDPFKKEETLILEFTPEISENIQQLGDSWALGLWEEIKEKLEAKEND